MDKNRFLELLQKCRLGTATDDERQWVNSYYDLFEYELGLEELSPEEVDRLKEHVRQGTWTIIQAQDSKSTGKVRGLFSRPLRIAAAAAVLLVAGSLLVYTLVNRKPELQPTARVSSNEQDNRHAIRPGSNKAILTLSNGQRVILDSGQQHIRLVQGAANVESRQAGELSYINTGALPDNEDGKLVYNTITTPLGGQFKLSLSDGTQVWLNAGSSLRYPVAFTGKQRQVWLTGEAYFEVARAQGRAFLVEADAAEVQVLGTHFDVNAYPDEASFRTTLAEGSVKVSGKKGSRLLKPGEQAAIDAQSQTMQVAPADLDMTLAWTKNLFLFDNTNIETIMRDISRWYDVKIVYATKNLSNKNFSGVMSRYDEVGSLLQRLELTGFVHFKTAGKTITVMD
ncbi:MAG TPA: FecR domain-containing protein [Puia sp.]|nr:FecR domain-containing protein [Puia sp.]